MFFLISCGPRERQLDFSQVMDCPVCGRTGTVEVYKRTQAFSLFFLPVYQWGEEYYARMSCCGAAVPLAHAWGKGIEDGSVESLPEDLFDQAEGSEKVCPVCGYRTTEDFEYCPHCGARLGR